MGELSKASQTTQVTIYTEIEPIPSWWFNCQCATMSGKTCIRCKHKSSLIRRGIRDVNGNRLF